MLDIATGTGIWAIKFAQQHPQATVIGTDLSMIQPREYMPQCIPVWRTLRHLEDIMSTGILVILSDGGYINSRCD